MTLVTGSEHLPSQTLRPDLGHLDRLERFPFVSLVLSLYVLAFILFFPNSLTFLFGFEEIGGTTQDPQGCEQEKPRRDGITSDRKTGRSRTGLLGHGLGQVQDTGDPAGAGAPGPRRQEGVAPKSTF